MFDQHCVAFELKTIWRTILVETTRGGKPRSELLGWGAILTPQHMHTIHNIHNTQNSPANIALSALCTSRLSSPVFSGRAHNLFVCYLLGCHPPKIEWWWSVFTQNRNCDCLQTTWHGYLSVWEQSYNVIFRGVPSFSSPCSWFCSLFGWIITLLVENLHRQSLTV